MSNFLPQFSELGNRRNYIYQRDFPGHLGLCALWPLGWFPWPLGSLYSVNPWVISLATGISVLCDLLGDIPGHGGLCDPPAALSGHWSRYSETPQLLLAVVDIWTRWPPAAAAAGGHMDLLAGMELSDEDQLLEWFAIQAGNIDLLHLDEVNFKSLLTRLPVAHLCTTGFYWQNKNNSFVGIVVYCKFILIALYTWKPLALLKLLQSLFLLKRCLNIP